MDGRRTFRVMPKSALDCGSASMSRPGDDPRWRRQGRAATVTRKESGHESEIRRRNGSVRVIRGVAVPGARPAALHRRLRAAAAALEASEETRGRD